MQAEYYARCLHEAEQVLAGASSAAGAGGGGGGSAAAAAAAQLSAPAEAGEAGEQAVDRQEEYARLRWFLLPHEAAAPEPRSPVFEPKRYGSDPLAASGVMVEALTPELACVDCHRFRTRIVVHVIRIIQPRPFKIVPV